MSDDMDEGSGRDPRERELGYAASGLITGVRRRPDDVPADVDLTEEAEDAAPSERPTRLDVPVRTGKPRRDVVPAAPRKPTPSLAEADARASERLENEGGAPEPAERP